VITENDVVKACVQFLEDEGWSIEQALKTNERGVDIVASRRESGSRLFVVAKGGTSSKKHTARFGKPFSLDQARSHISRALFEAARVVNSSGIGDEAALAFPDDGNHRMLVNQIQCVLNILKISLFWVEEDGSVRWARWDSDQSGDAAEPTSDGH
jgi:Restriction endonuclease